MRIAHTFFCKGSIVKGHTKSCLFFRRSPRPRRLRIRLRVDSLPFVDNVEVGQLGKVCVAAVTDKAGRFAGLQEPDFINFLLHLGAAVLQDETHFVTTSHRSISLVILSEMKSIDDGSGNKSSSSTNSRTINSAADVTMGVVRTVDRLPMQWKAIFIAAEGLCFFPAAAIPISQHCGKRRRRRRRTTQQTCSRC